MAISNNQLDILELPTDISHYLLLPMLRYDGSFDARHRSLVRTALLTRLHKKYSWMSDLGMVSDGTGLWIDLRIRQHKCWFHFGSRRYVYIAGRVFDTMKQAETYLGPENRLVDLGWYLAWMILRSPLWVQMIVGCLSGGICGWIGGTIAVSIYECIAIWTGSCALFWYVVE